MKYRSDIDGLRAFAVLPVLFSHIGNNVLPGGYAGVDIFFVISGFLITSLILPELADGTFSLARFYERRIRRIFPLLFLVITLCFLGSFWALDPGQLSEYAKSAIAALLSVSNIFFWLQDSYFAEAMELKPLMHTWSLGIEEQYYIVFPLFLLAFWRWEKNDRLFFALALLALVSFLLANWGGGLDADMRQTITAFPATLTPEYGYYLLTTRAWELLCGSLAAVMMWRYKDRLAHTDGKAAAILAWAGFAGIIVAYGLLGPKTPYPSLYTLPTVLGTVAIILYCRHGSVLHRFLSLKPLVFTGLISYSLYMWHQPIFALMRAGFTDLGHSEFYVAIAGIYALSILSWAYVEKPFRNSVIIPTSRLHLIMGGWLTILLITASVIITNQGFIAKYPPFDQQFFISDEDRGTYLHNHYAELKGKAFTASNTRKILIVGDSFSQDITNSLHESGIDKGVEVSTLYLPARCVFYLGEEDISPAIDPNDIHLCAAERQRFRTALSPLASQADTIIISAAWRWWDANRINQTLQVLHTLAPHATIIVMGTKSFRQLSYRGYYNQKPKTSSDVTYKLKQEYVDINNLLAHTIKTAKFIDVMSLLCPQKTKCPFFTPDDHLISYDRGHLTQEGARYLGQRLKESGFTVY
ncbi:MAG: acyltransferase family protein [Pseudomonadota bacterium]